MLGLAGTRWELSSVCCRPVGAPAMKNVQFQISDEMCVVVQSVVWLCGD